MTDEQRRAKRLEMRRYRDKKRGPDWTPKKSGRPQVDAAVPRCPVCGEVISAWRDCKCP